MLAIRKLGVLVPIFKESDRAPGSLRLIAILTTRIVTDSKSDLAPM